MVGYIGRQAVNGNFIKLDSITTSATTTFNLLNGGVAYSPESARNCIVSLNGVIQSPETAYNIVNNTIVFSETLASSDVIDHIIVLGDVNALATVSDGTVTASKIGTDAVTTAKIQNDAITEAKLNLISTSSVPSLEAKGDGSSQDGYIKLNCSQNSHGIKLKSPPHSANASYTLTFPNNDGNADEFLKTDGSGVMSWASAGGSNTPSFFAVSTSTEDGVNVADNTLTKMLFGSEVYDTDSNYASSRFTPTTAGKYFIFAKAMADNVVANAQTKLEFYKNGSQMDDNYRMRVRTGTSPVGDIEQTLILSAIIDMNGSGDYIEVYAAHDNGGNTSGLFDKHFGAYKIII